jgi:hypothetical protein
MLCTTNAFSALCEEPTILLATSVKMRQHRQNPALVKDARNVQVMV